MNYYVAYRCDPSTEVFFYRFDADNAEHALEQFRDAEPDLKLFTVVSVVPAVQTSAELDRANEAAQEKFNRTHNSD